MANTATFYITGATFYRRVSISAPGISFNNAIPFHHASSSITYQVSGPSFGPLGAPSALFSVIPSQAITDTMILSDGGNGGMFTPASLSWSNSNQTKFFTYTPASVGVKLLTLTSAEGYGVIGSPWLFTAQVAATSYQWSGATSGSPGVASSPIVLTANGWVSTDTVTFSDGGAGGIFTPASIVVTSSSAPIQTQYTPSTNASGTITLTATSLSNLTMVPASWAFLIAPAITYLTAIDGLSSITSPTVAVYLYNGTGRTLAPNVSVGAVVQTGEPGHYECSFTLPYYDVLGSNVMNARPTVDWTAAGTTKTDSKPIAVNQPVVDNSGGVWGSLTQTLNPARLLNGISDTALTVNDAHHAAIAGVSGATDITQQGYFLWYSSGNTLIRSFTLSFNQNNYPIKRT